MTGMKKLKDATKRFIRFDKHLGRLRLNGFLASAREKFKLPPSGFNSIEALEVWEEATLWNDKRMQQQWQDTLNEGLKLAKLDNIKTPSGQERYLQNVEQLITLDFPGGFEIDQPGIPHHRTDLNYLRSKKLTELSIDRKTGKKIKPSQVVNMYQPPEEWPQKKYDRWIDKYGVGSGDAVSKIISKHKRRLLE